MSQTLLYLALVFVAWGIVSSIAIVNFISKRGHKINYFLIRIMIYKYISIYNEITREENGRQGPWFYSYVVSMNAALVCVIIALVLRSW